MLQESESIEYKESLAEKRDAGADLVAFANKGGGTLYFGVRNNGDIKGIQDINEKTIRELAEFYNSNIEPKLYPKITIENVENPIIKVEVPKSDSNHHIFQGVPYIRTGPTSPKMSQAEYQRRLISSRNTNQDYSSRIIEGAAILDLSTQAILELRQRLQQSGRYERKITDLSDEQLLRDLRLVQDGGVTVAALILLGTADGIARWLPYAEVRYGYKISESEDRNQDTKIYREGYLLYFNKIWEKINSRNIALHIPQGMLLIERKTFDEQTIREAINNAVAHRDYAIPETIFIFQLQTKITFKSPGGLPEGVTAANIIDESKARNKLIADTLFKCELVEQFGGGVNLMFKNQLSLGKLPPNYFKSNENHVLLELDGTIQDVEFARYVLKVAEEKQKILNDQELLVLAKIKQNKKVKANDITEKLFDLQIIEKIGYGKWMLSKKYYIDTRQVGLYTRTKGLAKNKNKELILQHLKDFSTGAKKGDFIALFPESSWSQIWRWLDKLRKENKVYFEGVTSAGVWKLRNEIVVQ